MKLKNYFLLASSTIIMASCSEDSLEQMQQELRMVTLSASIESNETRASFDDNGKLAWSEKDAIWVQTSKGSACFDLQEGGVGQATGTFLGSLSTGETLGTFAVYPYNIAHSVSNANEITVTLPDSYKDVTDFENANAIMLATNGSEGSYSFKHLGGMLRFKISNFPQGATQAVLTTGNAISGSFNVTQNDENESVITSSASDENNSVALKFARTTQVEAKNITFPLPTGNYIGVKLEIKDATNKVLAVYNNPAKAYTIKRANRYNASITFTNIEAGSGEEAISTVYAKTEDELRAAFAQDANIVLEEDITLTTGELLNISEGVTITLDLNGKSLSYTSATAGDAMITNNGTFTIKDSGTDGKISYSYTGQEDATYGKGNYTIFNNGTLTIESGIVENTTASMSHASYAINTGAGASLTINGGKVLNLYGHAIRMANFGDGRNQMIVNGGYIEGTRAIQIHLPGSDASSAPEMNLQIHGGTLKSNEETYNIAVYVYSGGQSGENVSISVTGGEIDGDIALNGTVTGGMGNNAVTVTGGTFLGAYGVYSYAAYDVAKGKISITGGVFSSLEQLVYMGEGEKATFKLTENIDNKTITIPAGVDVTLDLNGKTISQTSDTPVSMITNNGNLTIKDSGNSGKIAFTFNGTVDGSKAANAIRNAGTLVVESGEISNTGTGDQIGYAIDNYNGATLTVNGGNITASGSSYYDGIRLFCGNNETTVTVNNGTISTIWAQNPSVEKASEVNGTVIINGGSIGTTYYENYTTVKVKSGVTTTVTPYGNGKDNTISKEENGYTVHSFVHS